MQLAQPELALWYSALFLELAVCALAFRRRLYRQLPIFTGYLTAVLARGIFMYWAYQRMGYASRMAFFSFWTTQAGLLVWRGVSIGELAWTASRPYLGLRVVMKWLVVAICSTLAVVALWFAIKTPSQLPVFVLALERDLELTAAVVLLLLLWLTAHYDVETNAVQRRVALGLFLYSLAQVINNAVSTEWLLPYFHWWGIVRMISFHVALVIWLAALLKAVPRENKVEEPVDLQPIRAIMGTGTEVMHDLSARLTRFKRRLH
jgi:hypothetical protein